MGHIVLIGGVMMLGFIATKKGYKHRWTAVLLFGIIVMGVMTLQYKQFNIKNSQAPKYLALKN